MLEMSQDHVHVIRRFMHVELSRIRRDARKWEWLKCVYVHLSIANPNYIFEGLVVFFRKKKLGSLCWMHWIRSWFGYLGSDIFLKPFRRIIQTRGFFEKPESRNGSNRGNFHQVRFSDDFDKWFWSEISCAIRSEAHIWIIRKLF